MQRLSNFQLLHFGLTGGVALGLLFAMQPNEGAQFGFMLLAILAVHCVGYLWLRSLHRRLGARAVALDAPVSDRLSGRITECVYATWLALVGTLMAFYLIFSRTSPWLFAGLALINLTAVTAGTFAEKRFDLRPMAAHLVPLTLAYFLCSALVWPLLAPGAP